MQDGTYPTRNFATLGPFLTYSRHRSCMKGGLFVAVFIVLALSLSTLSILTHRPGLRTFKISALSPFVPQAHEPLASLSNLAKFLSPPALPICSGYYGLGL